MEKKSLSVQSDQMENPIPTIRSTKMKNEKNATWIAIERMKTGMILKHLVHYPVGSYGTNPRYVNQSMISNDDLPYNFFK